MTGQCISAPAAVPIGCIFRRIRHWVFFPIASPDFCGNSCWITSGRFTQIRPRSSRGIGNFGLHHTGTIRAGHVLSCMVSSASVMASVVMASVVSRWWCLGLLCTSTASMVSTFATVSTGGQWWRWRCLQWWRCAFTGGGGGQYLGGGLHLEGHGLGGGGGGTKFFHLHGLHWWRWWWWPRWWHWWRCVPSPVPRPPLYWCGGLLGLGLL